MNKAIIDKLANFVEIGEDINDSTNYERWENRIKTFLEASLGPQARSDFLNLNTLNWVERHALQLGHIEGLIAKATGVNSVDSTSQNQPGSPPGEVRSHTLDSRKVFVVHGHDNEAKESVARFLEKLGLLPIILHEQASAGRTIIEKFEIFSQDVAFAVILLTPDDVGTTVTNPSELKKRARQNVIMELGYFIGKLGRTHVCALHKKGVELPSDYQGVLYIEMDGSSAWKAKLAQELVQSKVRIELTGLLGS